MLDSKQSFGKHRKSITVKINKAIRLPHKLQNMLQNILVWGLQNSYNRTLNVLL